MCALLEKPPFWLFSRGLFIVIFIIVIHNFSPFFYFSKKTSLFDADASGNTDGAGNDGV